MSEARNSDQTRRRLMDAAVELLRRDGPLNGIKLEEVARMAGVTATNVYHYFGNKQGLLRATIKHGVEAGKSEYASNRSRPLVERRTTIFRSSQGADVADMEALLVLDGVEVDPMPFLDASISDLRRDVIDGNLRSDEDLEALHIGLVAIRQGYSIFRRAYARRLGIDVDVLDERVTAVVERWLQLLTDDASRGSVED